MAARRGKIGVYSEKTRKLQRKLSFETFGLSFKDARFYLYLGSADSVVPDIDDIACKVFYEVPDRAYDPIPKDIPIGVEPDMESSMDFSRFGLISPLTSEKTFRVHIDDFETLGREAIVGDVFELPFFEKDGKKALYEITDVDLKLEYEKFIAIIKATPLTDARTTAAIDKNRGNDFMMSDIMDEADEQYSEVVPSLEPAYDPIDVVETEVDYRKQDQVSFLDDPDTIFNG